MKTKAIVMLWGLAAAGCSDEADIGLDSQPIGCMETATAMIEGEVTDPDTGNSYDFAGAQASASRTSSHMALLRNDSVVLRFGFYCGATEVATYGVKGDTQEGLECPLEVATAVLGRIEYLPAESGTLIVDETSNCLAGRFRVDFGEHGEIGGWFSTPWSP